LIELAGEAKVAAQLSLFTCTKNADVQNFLRSTAIPQEKGSKSRTYLIVDQDSNPSGFPNILAYFTLAIHIMIISKSVSKNKAKKLVMFYDEAGEIQRTPCFLIGQIGKDDAFSREICGNEIMHYAIDAVDIAHNTIGGRFIKIDCEDVPKLMELYARNGFELIQKNEENDLNELVMFY
jgi:hypothetical protein